MIKSIIEVISLILLFVVSMFFIQEKGKLTIWIKIILWITAVQLSRDQNRGSDDYEWRKQHKRYLLI